jgi:hypothetical protein
VYNADEQGHISNVTTANPLDQPFLPYLTFASELAWRGLQVKDAWAWARASSHDDLRAAPKTPPDLVCTAAYERHAAVASTEVLLGRLPIASATRILN